MEQRVFQLRPEDEFIELSKLLKLEQVAQTGGHAKIMIEDGMVQVNEEPESRKRRKLRAGDIVECEGVRIEIN